mgnify:CR=1 FL=1
MSAKQVRILFEGMPESLVLVRAALRGLGQGAQPYVGDRLSELEVPLLTVSGGADTAYTELARDMADAAPNGSHVVIDGAGHNVVLDAPRALVATLLNFIDG